MRCPKCGGCSFDGVDSCRDCGYTPPKPRAPLWWGSKNWSSNKSWKDKRKLDTVNKKNLGAVKKSSLQNGLLGRCSLCGQKSLFWNKYGEIYECLNPDCPYYKKGKKGKTIRARVSKVQLHLGGRSMLRIPVSILIGLCGLWGVVLGAHGLYVYISRLELFLGADASKLFFNWSMPGRLGVTVMWMSSKAIQSWLIPTAVFIIGWIILSKSGLKDRVSNLLSKIGLW